MVEIIRSANFLPPLVLLLLAFLPPEADRADVVLNLADVGVSEIHLEQSVLQLAVHTDHVEGRYIEGSTDTLLFSLGKAFQVPLQALQVVHVLILALDLDGWAVWMGRNL